jgi:hypothetical protein
MKWMVTLLIALLAVVALLLIWQRELGEGGGAMRARLAAGYLYPRPVEDLKAFTLVYPDRSYRLERREQGWWMTAPFQDRADVELVPQMIATLGGQKVERWLPPAPPARAGEMGLASPHLMVLLETPAHRDTLRFGGLNEVEKRLWVQTSWRDSLALVSTLLRTRFMVGAAELLDKRPLLPVAGDQIESVHLANARGYFELAVGTDGWEIRRPEPYRADDRSVQRLLDQVFTPTIVDFVDPGEEGLGSLGLESPSAELTIKLKGSGYPRRLNLGEARFRLRYAQDMDRARPFLLDSVSCAPLLESYAAYLSVVLFAFRTVDVLSIEGPGGSLQRIEGEDWAWRDAKGARVDGAGVNGLLTHIGRIATERVETLLPRSDQLAAWGLAPPAAIYRIGLQSGKNLVLEIGGESGGRVYFRRPDYGPVYSLPAEELRLTWPGSAETPPRSTDS